MLLCTTVVTAHDFEVDGICYNITSSSDYTVEVTYRGSSYSEYSNEYTGGVTIPSSVIYKGVNYSVTSIGDYAFRGCSGLTSVVSKIPAEDLFALDNNVFYGVIEAGMSDVYYDLFGRVVESPAKGIYIVNGKKVLVK